MEERNFILSFDEQKCRVNGVNGTLKTVKIEEVLKNGQKQTVHTDIHYQSTENKSGYQKLIKLLKKPTSVKERRAA